MNSRLDTLHPYPFERLTGLLADVPAGDAPFISLALGEPRHPTADFLVAAQAAEATIRRGFGTYPPTRGVPELRTAIAGFIQRRFGAELDPETGILPVNGTREALFAIAQAVIEPTAGGITLMPNPFYQIYEGAALLAGSEPRYLACTDDNGFKPDFSAVSADDWAACQALYLCTPGNPSGAVMSIAELQTVIRLAREHDFIIIADECYSEIYRDENAPPPGLLQAAALLDDGSFDHCLAFNSLSKRSNLPGLRSGYVAGDPAAISRFLLYRTYHGSAMPVDSQLVSCAAWNDDAHVADNRELYRRKFDAFTDILKDTWPMTAPPASFYLWPETPVSDEDFAIAMHRELNIRVLPGSYLSREVAGANPGRNRVRLALVATLAECVTAAERIRDNWHKVS